MSGRAESPTPSPPPGNGDLIQAAQGDSDLTEAGSTLDPVYMDPVPTEAGFTEATTVLTETVIVPVLDISEADFVALYPASTESYVDPLTAVPNLREAIMASPRSTGSADDLTSTFGRAKIVSEVTIPCKMYQNASITGGTAVQFLILREPKLDLTWQRQPKLG